MIKSKRLKWLNWAVMTAMLGMGVAINAGLAWADEPGRINSGKQYGFTPLASPGQDLPAPDDPLDETQSCEILFESDRSSVSQDREVEFRCLMDSTEWARYQEDPHAFPGRCVLASQSSEPFPSSEPLFLTAAAQPTSPPTLEVIRKSDTEVEILRPDGTKTTVKVPKGEIVNGVVQKNSPVLEKAVVEEMRNLRQTLGRKIRVVLKGGLKLGFAGLISLAATAGPLFAEIVIPDTCAALKDPDRGDSCKEVLNWVAKAQDGLFEKSCEACYNASLDRFPTKAAELCRAAENPATYDSVLQKVLSDLAERCGSRAGGYLLQKNNGLLPITGVTPPTLKEVCPFR
jgi:hypothetical protein